MISNDRQAHILAVAQLMENKSKTLEKSENYAQEMFCLGFVHDIGYEFGENKNHELIGGEILERTNYKYANEVKYHGNPHASYHSFELDLLNWADMHINSKGEYVEFDKRLKDIEKRYGKTSEVYLNACSLIEQIKEKNL